MGHMGLVSLPASETHITYTYKGHLQSPETHIHIFSINYHKDIGYTLFEGAIVTV